MYQNKWTRQLIITSALLVGAGAFVGCSDDDDKTPVVTPEESGTIAEIASGSEDFETLTAALQAADLVTTLQGEGPFTVFAPTDAAFDALPAGALDSLLADTEALKDVLLYHVVADSIPASEVVGRTTITTAQGDEIEVRVESGDVFINDAQVITTDIEADNGIIHVIDAVLLPPEDVEPQKPTIAEIASGNEDFETLTAALEAAGLVDTFNGEGTFTVFAPTDAAFEALPEGTIEAVLANSELLTSILTYHVAEEVITAAEIVNLATIETLNGESVEVRVEGDNVFINDAQVIMTDIEASNGIIHAIDSVLLPPTDPDPQTIAEIAEGNEDFETLFAALEAADLVDTLDAEGTFTVFAPTDDAFAGLPEGTVEALLADIPALTAILTYHVVGETLPASEVVGRTTIETLNGESVEVRVEGDNVFINEAQVIMTDISASNGIIHVIDGVLLPPAEPNTITDIVVGSDDFDTLEAAVIAADLAGTLAGEGPFTVFAPTDDAFAALPDGTLDALLADIPALTDILLYHVVSGELPAAEVVEREFVTTVQGTKAAIRVVGDNVYINGAQVTMTNIEADNGVIHVIDAVITPPGTITDIVVGNEAFSTLEAAVVAADLAGTLAGEGPFTVFAPTDDAFAALPDGTLDALLADIPALTDILLYHVVSGEFPATAVGGASLVATVQGSHFKVTLNEEGAFINDARITMTNMVASNGIIHVIDAVITPPGTITDIVVGSDDFDTLEAAVIAADLAGTLAGEGPFTVFAPTDDAFADLPDGTLDALLNDIPALTDILLYHVAADKLPAEDIVGMSDIMTVQGTTVDVVMDNGSVTIDGATVVITDIPASNGVIHVIDTVLIPE